MSVRLAACAGVAALLAACGSQPQRPPAGGEAAGKPASVKPPAVAQRRGGGYYLDDGPGDNPPPDLDAIPDAQPKLEPLHRFANNPYSVLGRDYVPMKELKPYKAQGIGSWYGRKFHGQRTSVGEPYDMYAMTAAHPTLPIPSYARVTNMRNGKSVVVRVNDRGPFLHDRLIDLSYAAAYKLGYVGAGSALLDVELILPGGAMAAAGAAPGSVPEPAAATVPATASASSTTPAPLPSAAAPQSDDPIAEVAARDAEPQRPLAAVAEARGLFLQLAAFSSSDNAETFRARLAQQLSGIAEPLQVHLKDGMYRLQVGPYRDLQEAGRVARLIRDSLELKPFVVQR